MPRRRSIDNCSGERFWNREAGTRKIFSIEGTAWTGDSARTPAMKIEILNTPGSQPWRLRFESRMMWVSRSESSFICAVKTMLRLQPQLRQDADKITLRVA